MTREEFDEAGRDFAKYHASEYALNNDAKWSITQDEPDDLMGEVRFKTWDGEEWLVVVSPNGNSKDGEAAIEVAEETWLDLDDGGLYCWLWHEACSRLQRAKGLLITIAQAEELAREKAAAKALGEST